MHCFYTEKENISDGLVKLRGKDVNHIKNVLRLEAGEELTVCDGDGTFFRCELTKVSSDCVTARVLEETKSSTELKVKITLFQGLPKKDKLELVIQKAVELGVTEVIPVATRFCVAKIEDEKKEKKKLERWQAISEAAAKQSGRGRIPKIGKVLSFQEALEKGSQMELCLIPYEKAEGMESFKNALKQCETLAEGSRIGIFIGPEGGFSEEEIQKAEAAHATCISLGKRILRTETAGLCVLSALMLTLEK
jgi:16S rRNA (uracil1498-N3)-methyltransferase